MNSLDDGAVRVHDTKHSHVDRLGVHADSDVDRRIAHTHARQASAAIDGCLGTIRREADIRISATTIIWNVFPWAVPVRTR